ncbi:MAG: hypothetical protein OXI73_08625, partial [Rhodospirillales bacterium]|nr:hypothetical protein [Rhodospirillales bacterium]
AVEPPVGAEVPAPHHQLRLLPEQRRQHPFQGLTPEGLTLEQLSNARASPILTYTLGHYFRK